MITGPNVNFMCTLGNDYIRGIRQRSMSRSMSLSRNQGGSVNNLRQLPRGRSPFRQSMQGLNMVWFNAYQWVPIYAYLVFVYSFLSNDNPEYLLFYKNLFQAGQGQLFPQQQRPAGRSRSRSRSRTRNIPPLVDAGADVDDRTFSEVMYSLSGNLGVTGRTLNDRFSF